MSVMEFVARQKETSSPSVAIVAESIGEILGHMAVTRLDDAEDDVWLADNVVLPVHGLVVDATVDRATFDVRGKRSVKRERRVPVSRAAAARFARVVWPARCRWFGEFAESGAFDRPEFSVTMEISDLVVGEILTRSGSRFMRLRWAARMIDAAARMDPERLAQP